MNKDNQSFWELLAGKFYHQLSEREETLLDELKGETKYKTLFKKGTKIYDGLVEVKNLSEADKNKSWQNIRGQIRFLKVRRFSINLAKYAALLIIAFIIGIYSKTVLKSDSEMQYAEIEVLNGQMGHLFLFDGTEVWLNSGSHFKYPNQFNQNEREVFLDGEAFFKVKKNENLPFKVKTSDLEIEVLGTSFNVSAYAEEAEHSIVLVEGKVQINEPNGRKAAELSPGQMASRSGKSSEIKVTPVSTNLYTSWKDGKVVFEAEKLIEIAQKLERWYNVEIQFKDELLQEYEFTGTILRNKPIDQVIMAFELLAPIKFEYTINTGQKDSITIMKK